MNFSAYIFGSSGSIPSPLPNNALQRKIIKILRKANGRDLSTEEAIQSFMNELPLEEKGTFKGNTSCVQILQDEGIVFCDAGSGLKDYVEDSDADATAAGKTYHFFISHLHWDHIQGLPFFKPAFCEKNILIFHTMHPELEATFRMQMRDPCFPVDYDELNAELRYEHFSPGDTLAVGRMKVKTIEHTHTGRACGFRFELGGKAIVYSSDCEHGPEATAENYPFIDFYRDADILIFDAQYTLEEANSTKRNWGHSSDVLGVELATRSGVKQLAFFHHDLEVNDKMLADRLKHVLKYRDSFAAALRNGSTKPVLPAKIMHCYDGLTIHTE